MPCYKPMVLYKSKTGPDPKSGKWPLTSIKLGNPLLPVQVPCSRCIGCRLERSRQWAIRCMNEAQMHENNCFITLTYSPENVTFGGGENLTLYPRHLQLFLKKLRKKYGNGIRFFACGEYGDRYHRPHYHAILFGHDFHDRTLHSEREGIRLDNSEELSKLWGLGDTKVGDVTFESAAYVARYQMKKKVGKTASYYNRIGIIPEFVRMSRRPGIGTPWLNKFQDDVFPHDYMVIRNGLKARPPKFYGSKYELSNPIEFAIIKERRKTAMEKQAKNNTKMKLHAKEVIKQQQIQSLKRTLD